MGNYLSLPHSGVLWRKPLTDTGCQLSEGSGVKVFDAPARGSTTLMLIATVGGGVELHPLRSQRPIGSW
jgi:hypothetical protein